MKIVMEPMQCKTVVIGEIIEEVVEFSFLGLVMTSSGQLEKELNLQV